MPCIAQSVNAIGMLTFAYSFPIGRPASFRPQICGPSRNRSIRICVRASSGPSRRTAALSTLVGTSAIAAAAGGPWLAGWGALFVGLGVVTEAPVGLMGVAATICASLVDLLFINAGSSSLDTGFLPFAIFLVGTVAAGITDSPPGPPALESKSHEVGILEGDTASTTERSEGENATVDEFGVWDEQLRRRGEKGDY